MQANMNRFKGLIHSQRVLLALTQKGVSREDAYALVQRNAMKVWEQGADFRAELMADPEVRAALSESEIAEKFDLGYHLKHVDTIFVPAVSASAQCMDSKMTPTTAMSCAQGTVWDADRAACVPQTNS
jgi:adenylosuccinate lyase